MSAAIVTLWIILTILSAVFWITVIWFVLRPTGTADNIEAAPHMQHKRTSLIERLQRMGTSARSWVQGVFSGAVTR